MKPTTGKKDIISQGQGKLPVLFLSQILIVIDLYVLRYISNVKDI